MLVEIALQIQLILVSKPGLAAIYPAEFSASFRLLRRDEIMIKCNAA